MKNIIKKHYFLLLILALHILFWLILKPAYGFGDKYHYAHYAYQVINGDFKIASNLFAHRFGAFIPTSLFFFFFGISPYTISLWSLVTGLLTIIAVYFFLKQNTNP